MQQNGGAPPDHIGDGISSFIKSAATGAGRLLADTLSGGKAEALFQKKAQDTQAQLKEQFTQQWQRGETVDRDGYDAWERAGGDTSIITQGNHNAISTLRERGEAENMIDAMHQSGMFDDKEANLYRGLIRNENPALQEIGKSVLSTNAKMSGEFMKYILGSKMQDQKQAGAEKLEGIKQGGREQIESSREGAAMRRTKYTQQRADARAKLAANARGKGKGPAYAKALPGAKDVIKMVTTGKDAEGNEINPKQKTALVGMANMRMVDEGATQADMLRNGTFMLNNPEDGNQVAVSGLNGIGDTLVDPKARPAYDASVRELLNENTSPAARQKAFERILALVPDDQRATVAQAIMRMMQDVGERQASDTSDAEGADEGDAADSLGPRILPPPPGDDADDSDAD